MREETIRGASGGVATAVASFITGLKATTIYRVAERKEIHPRLCRRGRVNERCYGWEDLVYLKLRAITREALSRAGRKELYEELRARSGSRNVDPVAIGKSVTLDIEAVAAEVDKLLAAVAGMEAWVTRNPEIRSGEPVIAGTRVPVYELAALEKSGASESELLDAFPTVSAEALGSALMWARINPRRGRPAMRHAVWRKPAPAK